MTSLNARSTRDGDAIVDVILEITNIDELEGIIDKLKRVKNVFDVYRMKA